MSDDELRRRLHDIPGPGPGIDVDAVLAGARRTRRPKVAAVTAATAGAGILIVAPFVAPGLQSFQPTSAPGLAEDAGAPAQEEGVGGGDAGSTETGATEAGPADGAALADACAAMTASGIGIQLRFLDDPVDGASELAVSSLLDVDATITLEAAGSAAVDAQGVPLAAALDPGRVLRLELTARATGSTPVDLGPRADCGVPGEAAGIAPLALVTLVHDGETSTAIVVGDPWGVR
ncbi:hypothetical protein [Agrococcus jenensis]|uniref:Uncharacterized protein n=1 Tax=Agrococcus jenensis TaxID=46353 RepID=A0A3N2ATP0_9MICO|nr:hypothetical protein [Agrococcus jenensis]ROR66407.1 hypothetical protein EDD26_1789 [Agrococcus jenensis]